MEAIEQVKIFDCDQGGFPGELLATWTSWGRGGGGRLNRLTCRWSGLVLSYCCTGTIISTSELWARGGVRWRCSLNLFTWPKEQWLFSFVFVWAPLVRLILSINVSYHRQFINIQAVANHDKIDSSNGMICSKLKLLIIVRGVENSWSVTYEAVSCFAI